MKLKKIIALVLSVMTIGTCVASTGCGGSNSVEGQLNIMASSGGFGTSFLEEMKVKFETAFADKGWKVNLLPSSGSFGTATALAEMRLGAKGSGYDLVFPGSVYTQDVVDYKNEGFGVAAENITETVYKQKPIRFDGTEEDITIEEKLIPDESSTWTAKHP